MKHRWIPVACVVALAGAVYCAPGPDDGAYDPLHGVEGIRLPGKADGLVVSLSPGDTVAGQVAGSSMALYSLELTEGAVLEVEVSRTAGDLEPQAYLFDELGALGQDASFLSPLPGYSYGDGQLTIAWEIPRGGQLILVVKAYGGLGAGSYALTVDTAPLPREPAGPFSEQPTATLPSAACLLDEALGALEAQPGLTFGARQRITVDNAATLSASRRLQLIRGLQLRGYDVQTVDEALAIVDDQAVSVIPFSAADGRAFVLYTYHNGDNPMGFVFADPDQPVMFFLDDFPGACSIEGAAGCLMPGETLHEVLDAFAEKGPQLSYELDTFARLPAILKQQLLVGVQAQLGATFGSPEEAFAQVDYGPGSPRIWTQLLTTAEGARFVYFDLTFGENGFGFIFPDAESVLAHYGDGYRYSCLAPRL